MQIAKVQRGNFAFYSNALDLVFGLGDLQHRSTAEEQSVRIWCNDEKNHLVKETILVISLAPAQSPVVARRSNKARDKNKTTMKHCSQKPTCYKATFLNDFIV